MRGRVALVPVVAGLFLVTGCTDHYAGDSRGDALDEVTSALGNQRKDAASLRLVGERHGEVLGRDAWVFEYVTPSGQRVCVYAWWDNYEEEDRSLVGRCV